MDRKELDSFVTSRKKELSDFYKNEQLKYVYYTIGLCIAAIGFSVNLTIDKPLKLIYIPLGVSLLCWSISTFLGLKFLGRLMASIIIDKKLIEISHKEAIGTPKFSEADAEKIRAASQKAGKKTANYGMWHFRLFLLGIVSFFIWRIVEMSALATNCP